MTDAGTWAEWVRRKLAADPGEGEAPGKQAVPGAAHERQPFRERQGNGDGERPPAFAVHRGDGVHLGAGAEAAEHRRRRRRQLAPGEDDADPPRPGDPPWRGRTARRSSSPEAVRALRGARLRRGWTITRAAEQAGISRPHASLLEAGRRRPSESVAEDIIDAYRMTPAEAEALLAVAVTWAGRDSPLRTAH